MISVEQAFKIIDTIQTLDPVNVSIQEALGYTLAEDVISPINMPPFNQSAMDGYAVNGTGDSFSLVGEIKAGDNASSLLLRQGEAVRIFTGAMVPTSATSVIRQEIVEKSDNSIHITSNYAQNQNIRFIGEQIEKGAVAAKERTLITPGVLGFLVGIGIQTVSVFRKPSIAILVTGDELIPSNESLTPGKIYESNSFMIQAAFRSIGYEATIQRVKDDFEATKQQFATLIATNDLIIATGGISVGDYDYVGKALEELGTEQLFYKVKQKPGKPLYLGKNRNSYIFGLPGNPGAALSCFYMYVAPVLAQLTGRRTPFNPPRVVELTHDYTKPKGLTQFLKANFKGDTVTILSHQSSAMLNIYTDANCILRLEENDTDWSAGDEVVIYPLSC